MDASAGQAAAPSDGFGGGFGERRGRGRGGRGRGGRGERRGGRGERRGRRGGRGRDDGDKEWVPVTKLGRLVKDGKIDSLETIYTFSLPIKESEIVDYFLPGLPKADPPVLRDEVMKIMPVQKQTRAGQRTKFKAFVVVGDSNGHIGLGVKCAKEVATAIRGAISAAKLQVIPVRRGWWGTKFGDPHTVPVKVTGRCGSVRVRLVPAPKGTGIVAAKAVRRVLEFAGIEDVYTNTTGKTATMGNFIKATFNACRLTYCYLTPDMWKPTEFRQSPYQQFTDFLKDNKGGHSKKALKDTA